jgi:hypothetical protein
MSQIDDNKALIRRAAEFHKGPAPHRDDSNLDLVMRQLAVSDGDRRVAYSSVNN